MQRIIMLTTTYEIYEMMQIIPCNSSFKNTTGSPHSHWKVEAWSRREQWSWIPVESQAPITVLYPTCRYHGLPPNPSISVPPCELTCTCKGVPFIRYCHSFIYAHQNANNDWHMCKLEALNHMSIYMHTCIYMYVYKLCVCVCSLSQDMEWYRHAGIRIYICSLNANKKLCT